MFVLVGRVLSLFGGRNQEIVIQRANTLLIIVPSSSVCCAKKIQPTSQWPTTYSLMKVYCGGGSVTSYVCSNIPSMYNDLINGGFRFPKDRDASEPNDGILNGTSKQRPTVQGYFVH